jgi:hypothetical protein
MGGTDPLRRSIGGDPVRREPDPASLNDTQVTSTPAPGDWDVISTPLHELRVTYRRLMCGYAHALGAAECEDRGQPGAPRVSRVLPTFRAPVLRLLIGAAVRKDLTALGARCTQIAPSLDPKTHSAHLAWLESVRKESQAIADGLPSLRLPGIFALVPFAIAVATSIAKVSGSHLPGLAWLAVGEVAALVGLVMLRDIHTAYRRKRELFLPGATELDRERPNDQLSYTGTNVYRDRSRLFTMLGTRNPRERPLDYLAELLAVTGVAYAAMIGGLLVTDDHRWQVGLTLAGLMIFYGYYTFRGARLTRRTWR